MNPNPPSQGPDPEPVNDAPKPGKGNARKAKATGPKASQTEGSQDKPPKATGRKRTRPTKSGRTEQSKAVRSYARNTEKSRRDWTYDFIVAMSKTGNVAESLRACGVCRNVAYARRASDPVFAVAWDNAKDDSQDALEQEARRRATEGTEKPVFYRGEIVGRIREYSDNLLMFLMKAGRPELYRDNFDMGKLINAIQAGQRPTVDPPSNPPESDPSAESSNVGD